MQSDASAAGFRVRGGARDLLSQAHEHEQGAQEGPQEGTQGATQGRTQGGDQGFTQQQRSSSRGTHMGGQEGLTRTALSRPLTEQGALSSKALRAVTPFTVCLSCHCSVSATRVLDQHCNVWRLQMTALLTPV